MFINTFTAELIEAVRTKTACSHVALGFAGMTLVPKALESCSNPQKTWQVFELAMKKILWSWVSDFL